MKTAVIIKGNPKFVEGNPDADKYYANFASFLESLGFSVTFDPGLEYTSPAKADLWVSHSRGKDRLKFASEGIMTIATGIEGGINHPDDTSLKKGDIPDKFHYILTDEMKEKIKEKLMKTKK
jgi:hypothetical protein